VRAACFPAAICLAATFDTELARRVGEALGEDAESKGVRCLLAPTVCNHRHPLGGRNFESFSEDVSAMPVSTFCQ
jgi:beta-glucosidase